MAPRSFSMRNKPVPGSWRQPFPPLPRPGDSNEKLLKYFQVYFAAFYELPPNSQEIQTLDFSFDGTGADLYTTSEHELYECLGNWAVGIAMYNDLQESRYAWYYLLKELCGFAPTMRNKRTQIMRNNPPFGSSPQPFPLDPHPHDPNPKILEYFRAFYAAWYDLPLSSQEIQSLVFTFDGTGADPYLASEEELGEYLGNFIMGIHVHFSAKFNLHLGEF
ncbi:hypothetical protein FQN50_000345 [Emmonsiellopsis sp. PD_5]|nr:hypothetical protein FQN50_000345 [Emmonsiellopsis sp. PD_5]